MRSVPDLSKTDFATTYTDKVPAGMSSEAKRESVLAFWAVFRGNSAPDTGVVDKEPVSLDSMDVVVDNVDVLLLDIVVAGVSVDGNRVALSLPRNRHKRSEKTSPSSATSSWISSSSSVTQNFTELQQSC